MKSAWVFRQSGERKPPGLREGHFSPLDQSIRNPGHDKVSDGKRRGGKHRGGPTGAEPREKKGRAKRGETEFSTNKENKMKKLTWGVLALSTLMMSGCVVGRKKFEQSENARWRAYYSRDSLAALLNDSRAQYAALDQRCGMLMGDTALLKKSIRNYQAMLANNQSENKKLNSSLAQKIKELQEREQTIAQLQRVIDEQQRKVKELLASVKDALLGFSSDDLTVTEKDGKVYVSLSDKLLFESGKAVVNQQGREALGKLAQVLNRQTEIDVYIEGHTDNVPIHTAVFQDNWDLSVIRATSVVRILTETYNVNPLQIQPCGRGEFKPVDTNETSEGRAHNRRTEIIMAPRLDKLLQLLQSN